MTEEPNVKKVPLTYNGITVGEAEVEFDEKGANIKAHVYHPDVANKILRPELSGISYGFDAVRSLDFTGVVPDLKMVSHLKGNRPVLIGPDNTGSFIYKSSSYGSETTMLNPEYHINRCRDLLNEFEPSRERSLAATKLDEFELWLTRCTPTQEALNRDGSDQK